MPLRDRDAPLELSAAEFRTLGHDLVERIADFLDSLPSRPVSPGETPEKLRVAFDAGAPLPEHGAPAEALLAETAELLFEHSLFNGHPRFWGYVTSSAAPIGALADLLAAAVNPNVAAWPISPVASEIEGQTVRWIAELIGFPTSAGGLLVSGGNMANFVGFLAGRRSRLPWDVRSRGIRGPDQPRPRVYASEETHTWLPKAADLFGLGTESIRWLPTDDRLRMDVSALRKRLRADQEAGDLPLIVVATAGSVSTGAVDPIDELVGICRDDGIWLHVDGAYGGFAAALPDAPAALRALGEADSVAVDPHKWLYAPLEAGCALVRDPAALHSAFSGRPDYYHLPELGEGSPVNYFEWGPQNSRGFRALKVWLGLRQAGREGCIGMIADDVALAGELYRLVDADPELEAFACDLSITTFRYVPRELERSGDAVEGVEAYLNDLNTELLSRLQAGGEAFVSNAVVGGRFLLRACIVNFRTQLGDVEALPGIVKRLGAEADAALRPAALAGR